MGTHENKIAFLFPGQGTQRVGMGIEVSKKYPEAKRIFEIADEVLGYSLSQICFDGPLERLSETRYLQPAMLTVSIAYATILEMNGLSPFVACGQSVGEYSALAIAKALLFEDALRLVQKRAELMQEAVHVGKGGMIVIIGAEEVQVRELIRAVLKEGRYITIAGFNAPTIFVLSGDIAAIQQAKMLAPHYGAIESRLLDVTVPFHSKYLSEAAEELKKRIDSVAIESPVIPVIANWNAQSIETADEIRSALYKQVCLPVLWRQTMEKLVSLNPDSYVHVGPGRSTLTLLKRVHRKVRAFSVDNEKDFNFLLGSR